MGIFGFLKKKPVFEPANLGELHTDIHSHFIPGIDDGAATMDDTIALLREMQAFGYKKVITTPHVMSDYYKNTPEIILGGLEKVREQIVKEEGLDIDIEAAAEYNIDADFESKIEKKEILTFGDNYVLVEMPFIQEPMNLKDILFKLQMDGYKPVMAHVERYPFWHQSYEKIIEIKERGILLQLNINSLTGFYGPMVKKIAERLVDDRVITLLGSDCHHLNHVELMKKSLTVPHLHYLLGQDQLLNRSL